jgi:cytochrome c oxidase subunit 3
LWVPTALVLLSSATMALAQRSARSGDGEGLTLRLGVTTLLGVAFVTAQVLIWQRLLADGLGIWRNVYGAIFYLLTGLHAFHMVTGVCALGFTFRRASLGAYTARSHMGVRLAAIYWHFLGGLWVFLFAILYLM